MKPWPRNHKQRYLQKMAEETELQWIDEHHWVELVYDDLPPVKVNPWVRCGGHALVIGGVACLPFLFPVPHWFAALCAGAWITVVCLIWLGSMLDDRNA
jgi:hypothetical protein